MKDEDTTVVQIALKPGRKIFPVNTKAIRYSKVLYVEPRASEGENTLEALLGIVQKELEENFVLVHKK